MNPIPTFHLRLFGSPRIAREDGTLLAGPATHRHRLALLSLLALAPRRALNRERLMAYLWPERDTDHARDLLNQAVYSLRKTLGDHALLSTGAELALNPEIIRADVWEFESALERGQCREAVTLYQAPFLDAFFLDEASDFERWVDQERARLAADHARALEALAEAAEEERDLEGAVTWWRSRAVLDPYDARVAIRLMRALDAAGNRAGALQHAALHRRLLEEEFGAGPDAGVLALAERLRNEPSVRVDLDATPTPPGPRSPGEDTPAPTASTGSPQPPRIGSALRLVAAAALVGAVFFGASQTRESAAAPEAAPHPASIAVLPLVSLGPDSSAAPLARGMTEALNAMLGRTGGIRVVASTGTAGFQEGLDPRRIADSLGVANILQGSVQKAGSRLRVGVRLVDGSDGSTRWSETFDQELTDVFEVQDAIARAVGRELGVRLGGTAGAQLAREPTSSVAAYELYLLGSDPTLLRSDSTARVGLQYFRRALELDSTYAGAWAGLARMQGRVAKDAPMPDRARDLGLAEQAARRAVALDGSLAEAHATLGALRMVQFDFGSAERHLDRALALDPTRPLTHEWLVTLHLWTDRPAEALADAERALALAPLSPTANAEMARALLGNDRCEDALARLARLSALQPPLQRAAPIEAECYARKGMWAEAVATLRPAAGRGGSSTLGQLGFMLARSGQREEALRVRAGLVDRWQRGEAVAYPVALVAAGLDDFGEAFEWLDRAFEDGSLNGAPGDPVHLMIMGPLLEDLRRDPRFRSVRPRLGLAER